MSGKQTTDDPLDFGPNGPLGKAVVQLVADDGHPWVAEQCGGLPGEDFETVHLMLALDALHRALGRLGIAPEFGPAPVTVTLSERDFIRLRDRLAPTHDSRWACLFRRPRNKRIDQTRRSFMLRGIVVRAGDLGEVSFACPSKQPRAPR